MTTNTPSSVSDEEVGRAMAESQGWRWGSSEGPTNMVEATFYGQPTNRSRTWWRAIARAAIATMTDTRVAEAVDAETEACARCADDFDGPYGFPGVNEAQKIAARIRNRPRQRAAIRNEGKSAPPVDQMKGEGGA